MDVRMTNAMFRTIQGDLHAVAGGPAYLRSVLLPGEVALFSSEDPIASFYLVRLSWHWHRYFAFRLPVDGKLFKRPGETLYLASVVLPMGFSCATGFMQAWHRAIALRPPAGLATAVLGLDPRQEVRGDKPYPVSASEGERSSWSIYIDDFLDVTILLAQHARWQDGLVSTNQGTLRLCYSTADVLRNLDKAHTSAREIEHLGYWLEGTDGWYGVGTERHLESA